ncbi:MAG TPA: hypothetical protein VKP30_00625, partial [Polyangiaceae bacterium]|nr:hypothetical protein [Polyangiaceae bacterium]
QPFPPRSPRALADAHSEQAAEVPPPSPPLTVTLDPIETEGSRARPAGAVAGSVYDEQLQTWNMGGRSDPNYRSSRDGYHPGTRVRVDATIRARSKAGLTLANRIQASFRNRGYWPFRTCYEDGARERPNSGGKTWLRVSLRADGFVLGARVTRTDLSERRIATCLAKAARHVRIPNVGRRVDAELMVAVWPGDVPLLPLPDAAVPAAPDGFNHTLVETEPGVQACFRSARQRDPALWGRLALSFGVDDQGRAFDVREYQSQFGDPAAAACVATLLTSLGFPPSSREAPRIVAAWRLHPATEHGPEPSEPAAPQNDFDSRSSAAESE